MGKRKRAKGEGTIYYSKARGKWVAQLPAGPDGRRHRRTASSEAEALKLLRQMHAELAAGRDLSRQAETVKELLDDWVETIKPNIRPTTLKHYQAGCNHISGRIGKVKAQDVTTEMVQRVANDLTATGLGPATVRAALSRLRAAYERLIPERFSTNPVSWQKLRLRKSVRPDRRPLDAAQLRRLLLASADVEARGGDARWVAAVWLAGLLGMRRGEVMGLCWKDVDLDRAELHIRQQRVEGSPGLFSPPKTAESRRSIPIGPQLLRLLQAAREIQQAERKYRGKAWKDLDLVVCREDGTPPVIDLLYNQLASLSQKLHLQPVNPHLLRHTVASLIDELGYSETIIGAILGHTSGKSTTRRYTHARYETMRRAVEAVEQELFGGVQKGV
jgi:integrase